MLSYCSLISIHGEKQSEDAPEVIVEERIKAPRDAAVHLRVSQNKLTFRCPCSGLPSPAHICSSGLGVLQDTVSTFWKELLDGEGHWLSNFLPAETFHS